MPVINVIGYTTTRMCDNEKYLWICPNPDCYYWNYFDNDNITMCCCKGCSCFIKNHMSLEELCKTFTSKYTDDIYWFETDKLLNTKYSLGNEEKTNVHNFYEFVTDNIYKEINREIVIINKEVNDAVEAYKQYEIKWKEENDIFWDNYWKNKQLNEKTIIKKPKKISKKNK